MALDKEFGAGGEGLDLYSTIGNINKAAGVYTSEMFGAIAGQTDDSFDFEAFNKYYTWDSEAQGFIQTGAGTTKEALIAIYGEDVPEAIINAYDASEFDKEVRIKKLVIKTNERGYRLIVTIDVPFGTQLSGKIHNMQQYIITNIERYTGILIEEVSIIIDKISKPEKTT